jgi:hypothetical protein
VVTKRSTERKVYSLHIHYEEKAVLTLVLILTLEYLQRKERIDILNKKLLFSFINQKIMLIEVNHKNYTEIMHFILP